VRAIAGAIAVNGILESEDGCAGSVAGISRDGSHLRSLNVGSPLAPMQRWMRGSWAMPVAAAKHRARPDTPIRPGRLRRLP